VKGLVPVAMLLIGRGRPREHNKGTSDHVTSRGSTTGHIQLIQSSRDFDDVVANIIDVI
jgi:hypothetical protein